MTVAEVLGPVAWFSMCLLLALAGTWAARRYALGRGLLDQPGARRSHSTATPRGGGIAIVGVALIAMAIVMAMFPGSSVVTASAAVGLVLVAGAGWIDDHRPLPAMARLLVHLAAGSLLAAGYWWAGQGLHAVVLAFVAVPILVNVWNFMDGIDGLAASQAAIAAGFLALLGEPGGAAMLAWATVAACCGFLPSNFPRARIFLGDVGSGALGFLLAMLLVSLSAQPAAREHAWPLLVVPLAPFLVDASLTLAWRIVRGEPWWQPHVQHAYQRLAARLRSHWPVTLGYGVWSVTGSVLALTNGGQGVGVNLAIATTWMALTVLGWGALQGAMTMRRNRQGSRS